MAPPEQPFAVSQLPQRVNSQLDQVGRLKSRKLGRDFDLTKCELRELVQYSCTPWQESISRNLEGKRQECWPVVRLFRRCRQGEEVFHVETTAWEGDGAFKGQSLARASGDGQETPATAAVRSQDQFADYSNYFWRN